MRAKAYFRISTPRIRNGRTAKENTGLFFRGDPGTPCAVVCPDGGFSYVGSMHERLPLAKRISELSLNAFVIRYRIGSERSATEDLAAALHLTNWRMGRVVSAKPRLQS